MREPTQSRILVLRAEAHLVEHQVAPPIRIDEDYRLSIRGQLETGMQPAGRGNIAISPDNKRRAGRASRPESGTISRRG